MLSHEIRGLSAWALDRRLRAEQNLGSIAVTAEEFDMLESALLALALAAGEIERQVVPHATRATLFDDQPNVVPLVAAARPCDTEPAA